MAEAKYPCLFTTELLADRLADIPRPAGFDFLRISLAYAIVAWHTIIICYGAQYENHLWFGPLRSFLYYLVPTFFALSGFLVAGSMDRNDPLTFAWFRFIRIFPALSFEVFLSAILLGLVFSTLSFRDYVSDPGFWRYFSNILGAITYHLPGVFGDHPDQTVNRQLWTVPIELEVYVGLVLFWMLRLFEIPRTLLYALVIAGLAYALYSAIFGHFLPFYNKPGNGLVMCTFFAGVLFYRLRDRIVLSFPNFLLAVFSSYGLLWFEGTKYLAVIPLVYATVWLGTRDFTLGLIGRLADYSYGVYLFGYPLQQTAFDISTLARHPLGNFLIAAPAATVLAAFSWHVIEHPLLRRRKQLYAAVGQAIGFVEGLTVPRRKVERPEAAPAG